MPSNKKIGNDFEKRLAEKLFEKGFWVHRFTQNSDGQPADMIAVKNGRAYLIDAKACSSNDRLELSRIEENQENAMVLWKSRGNGTGWFAIEFPDITVMINHAFLTTYKELSQKRYIGREDILKHGYHFEKWCELC